MLFLSEQRINIGINPNACETKRHGVLWAVINLNGEEQNVRLPVIIDKPNLVCEGLNYATWRRVKRQIEQMGVTATHIELKFDPEQYENGGHFCYELGPKFKETYNARGGKGRSKSRPLPHNHARPHEPSFA